MATKGGTTGGLSPRQKKAIEKRERATDVQIKKDYYDVPYPLTDDEKNFPRYAASFHKLLEHDADGLLSEKPGTWTPTHKYSGVQNYKNLLDGLGGTSSEFDSEKLTCLELCNRNPPGGRPRVLINPRSSKAFSIKGPDITSLRVSELLYGAENEHRLLKELSLGSHETAAEMIEIYAMALLRDVRLGDYSGDLVNDVVNALQAFGADFVWGYDASGNRIPIEVNAKNLFRGPTPGDLAGDYLSVFLTHPRPPLFPAGCAAEVADLIGAGKFADLLSQDLLVPHGEDHDFVRTREKFVCLQNAFVPELYPKKHFTRLGPIVTGRHLGDYVHVDNVYEEYIRAADILAGNAYKRTGLSPYSPPDPRPADCRDAEKIPWYRNEGDGPTLGPSDIYALLGAARGVAERAAFTQKWLVARRARPEVMAMLIDHVQRGTALGKQLKPLMSPLLSGGDKYVTKLLERVAKDNKKAGEKNYLLSQMYPEGSPSHPAWPSGHATVAGACVTVLKAFFDEQQHIRVADPKQKTKALPGSGKCQPSLDAEAVKIDLGVTVGGELDKLASNVALGRDWGGVHYRTDGEHGIRLGEEVAIRFLQDHLREYREQLRTCHGEDRGLTLTKRNGQRICITADKVYNIAAAKMLESVAPAAATQTGNVLEMSVM